MSDPTECRLTITGPSVDRVLKAMANPHAEDPDLRIFDFNRVIPSPPAHDQDGDWRRKNWGTSTNAEQVTLEKSEDESVLYFYTAWPPRTWW